jgi:hypothetical protein
MRLAGRLAVQTAALAASLLAGLSPSLGCLLDLPSVCGDGVIDLDGGEECDPAAKDAPPCDPVSCTRVATAKCGNGKIDDTQEQCDLTDFGNKDCPSGKGFLSCTADCLLDDSTCDQCGNGQLDAEVGEECDPKASNMSLLQPKECSELTTYPTKPYTSGQTTQCLPDKCLWYRGPCGFCGDDKADDPQILDINFPDRLSPRESCDGKDIQIEDLTIYCEDRGCPNSVCAVKCLDTCDGFVDDDDARCCQPAGSDCPAEGQDPCCYAYDNDLPDLYAEEACVIRVQSGGLQKRVCRSSK